MSGCFEHVKIYIGKSGSQKKVKLPTRSYSIHQDTSVYIRGRQILQGLAQLARRGIPTGTPVMVRSPCFYIKSFVYILKNVWPSNLLLNSCWLL